MLDLKNARDRLSRYKQKLQQDDAKLVQRAREAKEAGDQKKALGILRLRRYKQREVDNVEGQLLTVLQMVETIGSKQSETELLAALKSGKDALSKMHQEHTIDDVLELMDQVKEENEVETEINSILQNVPSLSVQDEQDVEAELEALQQSQLPQKQQQEPLELPTAPVTKLPEQQEKPEPAPIYPAQVKTGRVAVPS